MGKIANAFNQGYKSSGQAELAQYHTNFNQFLQTNPYSYMQGDDDSSELAVYTGGAIALINSAINRKMTDVRNRDYYFKKDGEKVEWKDVPEEIRMPFENGFAGLSLNKMLGLVCGHEDLTGNAIWLKDNSANRYTQLYNIAGQFIPITPGNYKIKLNSKETAIEYYTITWPDGSQVQYAPDKIIHYKRDPLKCPFVGIGLISQSRSLVEYEKVAQDYQTNFLEKDGTPDLIYLDKNMSNVNEAKNKAAQLRADYRAGKYSNSIMYAYGDVDVKSFSLPSSDLQFVENRNFNKEDLISIMESTAVVLGREKDAGNYAIANKSTQNYFARVNARIYDFLETLNMQYVYTVKGNEKKQYELCFEPYATGDIDEIQKAVNSGLMSPYDGAKSMGYSAEETDATKSLYVGAGLRTLEYAYQTQPMEFGALANTVDNTKKKTKIRDYE